MMLQDRAHTEREEALVPTCGFREVGRTTIQCGEFVGELCLTGSNTTELRWHRADGKVQKSLPALVKRAYAEQLHALKQCAHDALKHLRLQRDRLDRVYLQQQSWPLHVWRERYVQHPLLGVLARRLIWHFSSGNTTVAGIWLDDQLVDVTNQPLHIPPSASVSLWHPLDAQPDEVRAWRHWLLTHQVTQPFKQAHREIYRATDAEPHTHTSSNRFAAHIIKQHQFNALCATRGWDYQCMGAGGTGNALPRLHIPAWDLWAEFCLQPTGNHATAPAGAWLYVGTDQVRFYAGAPGQADPQPLALARVPALVFSEVMRDVDLFVGVCSIGNDPMWSTRVTDSTPPEAVEVFDDYWHAFSFGALSATARTRAETLQRLLPRLHIADRCTLQDRFLVVRGQLCTYKIHLGSGSILMEPNDHYLCLVAQRARARQQVMLPFEGDRTLSLILSQAFLLADDHKIHDLSIRRQIIG